MIKRMVKSDRVDSEVKNMGKKIILVLGAFIIVVAIATFLNFISQRSDGTFKENKSESLYGEYIINETPIKDMKDCTRYLLNVSGTERDSYGLIMKSTAIGLYSIIDSTFKIEEGKNLREIKTTFSLNFPNCKESENQKCEYDGVSTLKIYMNDKFECEKAELNTEFNDQKKKEEQDCSQVNGAEKLQNICADDLTYIKSEEITVTAGTFKTDVYRAHIGPSRGGFDKTLQTQIPIQTINIEYWINKEIPVPIKVSGGVEIELKYYSKYKE